MIAVIIDDNANACAHMQMALTELPIITSVHTFHSCSAALEWMQEYPPDLVFMECIVGNYSTISVADTIQKSYSGCKVIFCTAYPTFALDAYQIHAAGYLLKPITAERLQQEINHVCGYVSPYLLHAHCFGNFEVVVHNKPLLFKRSKTKELLALLIDRNGAGMTSKQICTYLWESDSPKEMNYLYQLFDDLRQTLKMVNAEAALVKNGNSYAVDNRLINCDYYSYLKTGNPHFFGEYMAQYSWAEATCAFLWQDSLGKKIDA